MATRTDIHPVRRASAARGQDPVLGVRDGPDGVDEQASPADRGEEEQPGRDRDGHDDGCRRHQSVEDPHPVAGHVDPLPGIQPSHEASREEERRDEEEDVDAAGHPAQPHVVGDGEQHGKGPQPFDVPPTGGGRLGHRCSQGHPGDPHPACT